MSCSFFKTSARRVASLMVAALTLVAVPAYAAITVNSGPTFSAADSADQGGRCRLNMKFNITPGTDPDKFRLAVFYDGVLSQNRRDIDATGSAPIDYSEFVDVSSGTADLPTTGQAVTLAVLERQDGNNNGVLASTAITANDVLAIGNGTNYCKTLADAMGGASTNTAPTANAGPDQDLTLPAGATITLDGTGSTDPEDDTLTYSWSQTAGPTVTLSDVTAAMPTFSAPNADAALTFELVVNDGALASPVDSVTVNYTLAAGNLAPIADAGPDQTLTAAAGSTITLDGTGSTDPESKPITYEWTQTSGPTVTLNDRFASSPTFNSPDADATLVFSLVVNDGDLVSDPDSVTINFTLAVANTAPTADAGDDQTLTAAAGSTITLDGSGSTDPENDSLTYMWSQTSGPNVTLSDATAVMPTFSAPDADAVLTFELIVNDGEFASPADSVAINFTLAIGNSTPTADAGEDQVLTAEAGSTISLDGSGSTDPENDVLTYLWSQTSGPTVTLSDATAVSPNFSAPDADAVLVFELVVNDGEFSSPADSVTINFTLAIANTAPTANAGPDQTVTAEQGATLALDGSGSTDPENDDLTYMWTQTSGTMVTLSDATAAMPTFSAPDADAVLVFSLVVNDGELASAADTVTLNYTAIPPNNAPVADAGPDQTLMAAAGTAVTLDGSGSSDADDNTLTYSWTQTSGPTVTLSGANTVSPTFNAPSEDGALVFSLIVNDGEDDSAADTVTVTFTVDEAPVATASVSAETVDSGGLVTLDGSSSTDAENATLTYSWTQTGGPDVTLSDATAASPTFTAPEVDAATALIFQLVVNDGMSDSAPATVTVNVQPTGSVTVAVTTQGGDGVFDFTSTLSDLSRTLTTSGGNGQFVATDIGAGSYTLTLNDPSNSGFAITDLSCSNSSSSVDVSARQASIVLGAGEDVTCTFSAVNSRNIASEQIRNMMVQRGTLLLANQPDMSRRKERLNGGSSGGSVQVAGLTMPGSGKLPLSASLTSNGGTFSTSLAQMRGSSSGKGSFDIWAEGTFANLDAARDEGNFSLWSVGVDYLVSDNLLIGVMGQHDEFNSNNLVRNNIAVDGDGYLVGPYVTARVMDNLYVDGRVAWGTSDNSISPLGTFVDEFDTDRFLASGSISGSMRLTETLSIVPTLTARHLGETQNAYTDSLGVDILEQDISLTEISFSPRVEYAKEIDKGWGLNSFVAVEGIYSAGDDYKVLMENEFRARIEGGATISDPDSGLRIGLSVFSDGIGSDDFSSEGFRLSVAFVPSR